MTPERLQEIRGHDAMHQRAKVNSGYLGSWNETAIHELLELVDELLAQSVAIER
jgi:hypothetical protein